MSQVSDRKTIGIPGPAGDASPEMIAAAEAKVAQVVDGLNLPGEVSEQVEKQLTPALLDAARQGAAEAIAENPDVIAEAAQKAIDDVGLVRSQDPRLPIESAQVEELLATVTDKDLRRSWLEARISDGGPSARSERMLRDRLGVKNQDKPGILHTHVDAAGHMSDLTTRDLDGGLADFVLERLAPRLAGYGLVGRVIDAPYDPTGGALAPLPKRTALAGWGSSTMEGLGENGLADLASRHGMTWYGGGKGGEIIQQHAARMGAVPALLVFPGGKIPASGYAVVTSPNIPHQYALRTYFGTVAGVVGEFQQYSPTEQRFWRTTPGAEVPVTGPTPFLSRDGVAHRADTILLQAGKNNLKDPSDSLSPREVAAYTLRMFDYQAAAAKRVLVIGQHVNTGTPASSRIRDRIRESDAILKATLGAAFFDTTAWVTSDQLWADTGITPTSEDRAQQAAGNKPPSVSSDDEHFNAAGYAALTGQIEARMTALGWLS